MKDIKYKQFINGEWFYWGFIGEQFVAPMNHGMSLKQVKNGSKQYVGEKDSKDKEIYVADILEFEGDSALGGSTEGRIKIAFINGEFVGVMSQGIIRHFDHIDKMTVIGNMTESRWLMRKE